MAPGLSQAAFLRPQLESWGQLWAPQKKTDIEMVHMRKNSFLKGLSNIGTGCPGQWWSHQGDLKDEKICT